MSIWQVRHKTHGWDTLHTIRPENLTFTENLDDIHTINYQISLDNPILQEENTAEGDPFGAYQTDWVLLKDGDPFHGMAGMITSINIPEGQEYVEIGGQSWLHYLDRRHYPFNGLNPVQVLFRAFETDVTEIIRSMINAVSARPHSIDFDLSDLLSRTTFDENLQIDFADTETILSKIKTLAEGKPGFDFAITWDKQFKLWYPEYSDPTNVQWTLLAGYPPNFERSDALIHQGLDWTDSGPRGTHIAAIGSGLANQFCATRGSLDGQETFRRLDFDENVGNVPNRAKLNRLADGALRAGVRPQREVPVKVVPEEIPDFWTKFHVGNYIRIEADLTAHEVGGIKKIISVETTVTNEGEEMVDVHSTLWRAWYDVDSAEDQV